MQSGGTRVQRRSRRTRWIVVGASTLLGLLLVAVIGVAIVYPRIGARLVQEKLRAKVKAKLGRDVTFGSVEVRLGHAVIRGLQIRGPRDRQLPLAMIDRIDVSFAALPSLVGHVVLGEATADGVTVTMRRGPDGVDNVSDLVARLRAPAAAGERDGDGPIHLRPTGVTVTHVRLLADDEKSGTTMLVADGGATWKPGELVVQARGVTATTVAAPAASATAITITKRTDSPPRVAIEGGELAVLKGLSLTGISGTVAADSAHAGQYVLDVAGGYGGVPGNLWTARGQLDPRAGTASVELEAARFALERLAPILARTAVVDYQTTTVDAKLKLDVTHEGGAFAGELHLHGLNVGHPMIADKEVRGLDLSAVVAGRFERATQAVVLTRGDFVARDVPFSVTGEVARIRAPVAVPVTPPPGIGGNDPGVVTVDDDAPPVAVRTHGPAGIQTLTLHFVIPPIDCQRVLDAIPVEMVPYMNGYRLKGTFDTNLDLEVDWANLDATKLGGQVAIRKCRVTGEPESSPRRLLGEFEHFVEVAQDHWESFQVGPSNADFVPYAEISPYLVQSIISTEDSSFLSHHGFIVSEFRTALVNDLKAGRFKYGASSITMQMVKNVLLYREKTLARKLQELFLTWHVENTLSKERILEIYFNVIEYGPGIYGIGKAAPAYFGKPAKDLTPREAAFFSSILPSPKERYKQWCSNELTKWTTSKIERILALMLKRNRLTQEEYDLAEQTPLVFARDLATESVDDCLRRAKTAIRSARSTNPLATDPAPPAPPTGTPKSKRSRAP